MTDQSPPHAALLLKDVVYRWRGGAYFHIRIPELSIAAGERVVLLGESGTGKSTLLSLICGVITPDQGRIWIAGTELTAMRGRARDRFRADEIGIIFQQFNLLPFATARDNILLPLQFAGKRRRRRTGDPNTEALRLTRLLGLPDELMAKAKAMQLSVGQQQRVAIARALIASPSLIIADEPTSSLDARAQSAFLDLLFEQTEAAKSTLIMVTHDNRLAGRFDRALDLGAIARISRGDAA